MASAETRKLHDKFRETWPEYQNQHLPKICKGVLSEMGIERNGDVVTRVKNMWGKVCQFLKDWEGEPCTKTVIFTKPVKSKSMSFPHMTKDSTITFGKYQGDKLGTLPADYLLWLLKNDKCNGQLRLYIEANKSTLELQAKQDRKNRLK